MFLWFIVWVGSVCYETCNGLYAVYLQFLPIQVTQDRLDYKVPKELRELLELAPPERWAPLEDRDHQDPQVMGHSSTITASPKHADGGDGLSGVCVKWGLVLPCE